MARVKKLMVNKNAVTLILLALGYAVVAWMLYSGHITRQFTNMLIPMSMYIVLAVSLNLVVGFLGELNLGHAGFMSVGLFTGCLASIAMVKSLPLIARLPLCMLIGGICAGLFGFVVGMPALRLKGDYLAIVTLACGEIVKNVITNLSVTGGARGLNTQPIYSGAKTLLPYAIVLVFLTVIVMMHIKKSKQGRAIMAIRDNRIAAESIGLNVTWYKLAVFIIAAFFAGAAGALYGHFFANVKAVTFDYNMSIEILVIVVLGGMGSVRGSVIAAVVLQALPEIFRDFGDYRMLVYAVVLILAMLFTNSPQLKALREKLSLIPKLKAAVRKRHLAAVLGRSKQETEEG
ncbi:MAG: branched-chain amino acid ABC transporter permease [Lachnospiraceae bacterium]|nr:branched-chain amino acid ABC transporter permease [Lachnospiraceae bacterium]